MQSPLSVVNKYLYNARYVGALHLDCLALLTCYVFNENMYCQIVVALHTCN